MGAESLGGALLLFGRRQIFLACGNGPADSERIAYVPVTVAPELIGDRHSDFASRGDGGRPGRVGIGNIEVEMKRQSGLREGRQAEFNSKVVTEHQDGIADADLRMHQFAAGTGRSGDLFGAEGVLQKVDVLGRA